MARSFVVRARIEAEDRASAQIAKIQTNTKSFEGSLRRLGVVLEKDVNATLRRNAVVLEEARKSYERGAITLRDYERAQTAVARQNEAVNRALRESGSAAKSASSAYGTVATSLRGMVLRGAAAVAGLAAITRGLRASVRGA